MINASMLVGSFVALLLIVMVGAVVILKIRYAQRRKALEQLLEKYHQSDLALVRYVMLNRCCSEEVAYQRLAIFIKSHIPLDDHSYVDEMLAENRQRLLDITHRILVYDEHEIEKI